MHEIKPNILVVEDIRMVQKTTVMTLRLLNCNVDTADNGFQALSMVKKNKYDLIFMDIGLPDIDGYTVTETIRNRGSEAEQPIIIALTAHMENDSKKKAADSGMNGFISKPLTTEEAEESLRKIQP
jgi:CheY-like chemotaxis protein